MSDLLWHSNAPWSSTGYGQQTGINAPLIAEKYNLTLSSFYGLEGAPLQWKGIKVLPGMGGEFGNLSLIPHATHVFDGDPRGGLVVTLMDVWVLDAAVCAELNMGCWVPIDHDPCPPAVNRFFDQSGAVPIAMSKFGRDQLERFDPLYVPHGIDTGTYRPRGRTEIRKAWGLDDDAFVVGICAANKGRPSRKAFSESLQALKPFMDAHENVYLYLHTTIDPGFAQGEDLNKIMDALEIPRDRVGASSQYAATLNPYPPEMMAMIYSGMDVLLNPAHGEGFGITPLEAQACGVPAIVQDFTAMTEVTGAGWHVGGRKIWTGQNSWQRSPNVEEIHDALEECYHLTQAERDALSAKAREHALEYSHTKVFDEYWVPVLASLEDRFQQEAPITIAPRVAA